MIKENSMFKSLNYLTGQGKNSLFVLLFFVFHITNFRPIVSGLVELELTKITKATMEAYYIMYFEN